MERIPNEVNRFSDTIKNSDLSSIAKNGMEITIDSVINNGLLKDVPIVNTLVSLIKTAYSIHTYLFLKKIIAFLNGIASINETERNKIISKIEKSNKYKIKVGEKLLFILDQCEDTEKSSLIAKAFSSFLKNEINYSDFIKIAHIINNIFIEDFYHFLKIDPKKIDMDDAELYLSFGLYTISLGDPKLKFHSPVCDGDELEGYSLEDEERDPFITDIGNKIRSIFGNVN
jgi:hypothetical protein